jgi:hypothetical protein
VRPVWFVLSSYFDALLTQLTLSDLIQEEKEATEVIRKLASERADKTLINIKKRGEQMPAFQANQLERD